MISQTSPVNIHNLEAYSTNYESCTKEILKGPPSLVHNICSV
jgi:hypothetical protein